MTKPLQTKNMWDPFAGPVPFSQQVVAKPGKAIKIPGFVRSFGGILLLLGILLFVVAIVYRDALWIGVPSVMLGLTIILGADHLGKVNANIDWLLYKLAKRHDWAFESLPRVKSEEEVRRLTSQPNSQMIDRRLRDPRIRKIHEHVGDLLKVKVGRVTMMEFNAIYRGQSAQSIPFWMAMGVVPADMTLAAPSLKTDRHGNKGAQAYMFQMLCAYRLDRDTGIRARLLHEAVTGESRTDFQTESVEFNRLFNISIADPSGQAPKDVQAHYNALLQALTPATQATLIGLKEKYDVQVVIDGDIVFYAGWDKLNSDDFDVIDQHIYQITEAFAQSALSFKRYVE